MPVLRLSCVIPSVFALGVMLLSPFATASAQSVPAPVHWYRFENDARDSIGTAHGTEFGGTTYRSGRFGSAFVGNGIDAGILLSPNAISEVAAGEFSAEAWFWLDGLRGPAGSPNVIGPNGDMDMAIVGDQEAPNQNGWRILKQSDNRIWVIGGGSTITSSVVDVDRWYHVVVTFSPSLGSKALYLDGVLVASAGYALPTRGTPEPRIGAHGEPSFFYGAIDEVKIYDVALDAAQVNEAFTNGSGGAGAPTAPRDLVLCDVDGDGDLDVVTANSASNDLGLWLGDGTGAFAAPISVDLDPADRTPVAIAYGDLDGDGAADDAAVACSDSHSVAIVTNLGSSPSVRSISCGGFRPVDVACGDFDGNGIDEVIVGRSGELLSGGEGLAISINGGPFTDFGFPFNGYPSRKISKILIADLNADGHLDFCFVVTGSQDSLGFYVGDGTGNFLSGGRKTISASGLSNGLCSGDFDGDGDLDLAVLLSDLFPLPQTRLQVFFYSGSGVISSAEYTGATPITTSGSFGVEVVTAELDGDSLPGFVTLRDFVVVHAGSGSVEALYGFDSASSTVQSADPITTGTNPIAAFVGDVNGDGAEDVVIANQGSHDLSVQFGVGGARAQSFGVGCAGTGGLVPELSGIGLPTLGNAGFGVHTGRARASAPFLLFLSSGQTSLPIDPCTFYLAAPLINILGFTDTMGENDYLFGVPNWPSLFGVSVYLQDAVFDPSGAFASTLALSNALRVQLGGSTSVSDERSRLSISGVTSGLVWVIGGPGYQIDRVQRFDPSGLLEYQSGRRSGLSVIFEAIGPVAADLDLWFASAPNARDLSFEILDAAGVWTESLIVYGVVPASAGPGFAGRTRYTLGGDPNYAYSPVTERSPNIDWGTAVSNRSSTDRRVEIAGVATGPYPAFRSDSRNRTMTLTYDYVEGGQIMRWAHDVVLQGTTGTGLKHDIVVIDELNGVEVGRTIYIGCFPIHYQMIDGFAFTEAGRERVVLSFDRAVPQ